MSRYENIDWTKQDCQLAEDLGVSRQAVAQKRRRLRQPLSPKHHHNRSSEIELPSEVKEYIGQVPDAVVASMNNCSTDTIRKYRVQNNIPSFASNMYIDWDQEHRLGKIPDAELASMLGVAQSSVNRARRCRKIPPVHPTMGRKNINWDDIPLGKFTDAYIASVMGTIEQSVASARKKRGIKSYTESKSEHG